VGRKFPNAWGLHDMHGNVWEWCWDWYGKYSRGPRRNPSGPVGGEFRILRGGAFIFPPRVLRSANRFSAPPSIQFPDFGFRCAKNLCR
jgi:formylglycine-generating enzyme required for sulfatase activity